MLLRKILLFLLVLLALVLLPNGGVAKNSSDQTVNVLTWWGFLDQADLIKRIERRCKTKVSFDAFYSPSEFLKRFLEKKVAYDVIIYPDSVFQAVFPHLTEAGTNLSALSQAYHRNVQRMYRTEHFPSNTIYFSLSLTGFLWNPKAMVIGEKDGVAQFFEKSRGKLIAILDDQIEAESLLAGAGLAVQPPSLDPIRKLFTGSKVVITNEMGRIVERADLAFSYTGSGTALSEIINNRRNLRFASNPELSHISRDLLSILNDRPETVCTGIRLGTKWFSRKLEERAFVFTPYGVNKKIEHPAYTELAKGFFKNLRKYKRLEMVPAEKHKQLQSQWTRIKVDFAQVL